MDAIILDDVESSRRLSPTEKLSQALEMAEAGIRLKRATLCHALPAASEEDIDAALEQWLLADD